MMDALWGMDTDEARAAAGALRAAAVSMRARAERIDAVLTATSWEGQDAAAFRERWAGAVRPALDAAADRLDENAEELEEQAAAQDIASAAGNGADLYLLGGLKRIFTDGAGGGPIPGARPLPGGIDPALIYQRVPPLPGPILMPDAEWMRNVTDASAVFAGDVAYAVQTDARVVAGALGRGTAPEIAEVLAAHATAGGSGLGLALDLGGIENDVFDDDPLGVPTAVVRGPGDSALPATPRSFADLGRQNASYTVGHGSPTGQVAVQEIRSADGGTRYIVQIPPTEADALSAPAWGGQDNPRDWSQNIRLMSGGESSALTQVETAMEVAGVPDGADVMLVGHSQGGIIAARLASDPSFNAAAGEQGRYQVTHAVTYGSPIATADLPADTDVLSFVHGPVSATVSSGGPEHVTFAGDPVPGLDLGGVRTDGTTAVQTGVTEIALEPGASSDVGEWVTGNHQMSSTPSHAGGYADSLDSTESGDARISDWRARTGADEYLGPDATLVSETVVNQGRAE